MRTSYTWTPFYDCTPSDLLIRYSTLSFSSRSSELSRYTSTNATPNLFHQIQNGHRDHIPRNAAALSLARSTTESMDSHHISSRRDRSGDLRLVHHCPAADANRHPLVSAIRNLSSITTNTRQALHIHHRYRLTDAPLPPPHLSPRLPPPAYPRHHPPWQLHPLRPLAHRTHRNGYSTLRLGERQRELRTLCHESGVRGDQRGDAGVANAEQYLQLLEGGVRI